MKIAEVVGFRREIFFEGAVQLGWLDKLPERADLAAASYVFHGPTFHAVGKGDHDDEGRHAALKDTATFFRELVAIATGHVPPERHNPFGIAIAGYGTGKSHLGLTLSRLLASYPGGPSKIILDRLEAVAPGLGASCRAELDAAAAPALVVALDGMKDFNLGSELYHRIVTELKRRSLDLGPIDELSPRFKHAEAFVMRNLDVRRADFEQAFGAGVSASAIAERLALRDEKAFEAVNAIYRSANGTDVGGYGQESPEELITTVCTHYCGPGKPFASLMIVFDEFGRYLEFAADKPHIAGDSGLQQMYQGVQTAGAEGRCYFLGLIQFEMKAYLSQLEKREAQHLQRFVSRFDQADKTLLSSNLETLFANILDRKNPAEIQRLLAQPEAEARSKALHGCLVQSLKALPRFQAWSDYSAFRRVIVEGCWPLHPTTVWFLARLSNVVQNRSALSFVEQAIGRLAERPTTDDAGLPAQVYPVDLLLGEMFTEVLEAEKRTHATIASEFAAIRERHDGKWRPEQERALAAVVIARKMQAHFNSQGAAHELLAALAGMGGAEYAKAIKEVIETYGVAEWNEDLCQYDLIIDAVPRSHFTLALRKRAGEFGVEKTLEHFRLYGLEACGLKVPESTFASDHAISTSDWAYEVTCSHPGRLEEDMARVAAAWRDAVNPEAPKGQVLYVLTDDEAAVPSIQARLTALLEKAQLTSGVTRVPIFGVVFTNRDGELIEHLARLAVLTKHLTGEERARFAQFLDAEEQSLREKLQRFAELELKQRRYVFPPGVTIESNRLNVVATRLFEAVYPQALSFVFDGFATSRGNAAKDCATLTRALACGQMDANWFATQAPPTQNRGKKLLGKVWQVLSDDMRPLPNPGYVPLKAIVDGFNAQLASSGTLDLHASFMSLIAPPYGFNTASAALVLAVFLNDREVSKSLVDGGVPITVDAWLVKAYNGKQLIEPSRLRGITVVPCEAGQDWEELLNRWFTETRYRRNLAFAEEARQLALQTAVPASHVETYKACCDRMARVERAVEGLEALLGSWQNEVAVAGEDVGLLLKVASQVLSQLNQMGNDPGWDASDAEPLKQLRDKLREIVRTKFATWLDGIFPENTEAVPQFQEATKRHQTALEKLGLHEEKLALHSYSTRVVEILVRLASVKAFLQTHMASSATPVPTLRQWMVDGHQHLEQLKLIPDKAPREQVIANALEARLGEWNLLLDAHRNRVQSFGQRTISTYAEVMSALDEATTLAAAFRGAEEQAPLEAMRAQLAAIATDWEDLQQFEGTEEELTGLVDSRLLSRIPSPDSPWKDVEVYRQLLAERVASLRERGERWFLGIIPNQEGIHTWMLTRCQEAVGRLSDCPPFASSDLRLKVEFATHAISGRIAQLEEQERLERVARWKDDHLPSDEAIAGFGLEQLRAAHRALTNVPSYLMPFEAEEVARVRMTVEQRLDLLDFQQLVERARRLPMERQRELALALLASGREVEA